MRSSPFTAIYDACVLYPAPLRDFLMWLGLSGRFHARWSPQIHDEWKRNLLINRPDLTSAQLDRTSGLMDLAIPDGLVTGHETLITGLTLPDADDRHVLAAAIRCNASVIVTFNEKDFPASALAPYGIEAQHPTSSSTTCSTSTRQRWWQQPKGSGHSSRILRLMWTPTSMSSCARGSSRPPRHSQPIARFCDRTHA